jgi:hypothetical protein
MVFLGREKNKNAASMLRNQAVLLPHTFANREAGQVLMGRTDASVRYCPAHHAIDEKRCFARALQSWSRWCGPPGLLCRAFQSAAAPIPLVGRRVGAIGARIAVPSQHCWK